jgi:hypothetical protein
MVVTKKELKQATERIRDAKTVTQNLTRRAVEVENLIKALTEKETELERSRESLFCDVALGTRVDDDLKAFRRSLEDVKGTLADQQELLASIRIALLNSARKEVAETRQHASMRAVYFQYRKAKEIEEFRRNFAPQIQLLLALGRLSGNESFTDIFVGLNIEEAVAKFENEILEV